MALTLHYTQCFLYCSCFIFFYLIFDLFYPAGFLSLVELLFTFCIVIFWLHHQNSYAVLPGGHLLKFGQTFNPCTDNLHQRATTITGELRPWFYCGNDFFHIQFKQYLQQPD